MVNSPQADSSIATQRRVRMEQMKKEGVEEHSRRSMSLTQEDGGRKDWRERLERVQMASQLGPFRSFKAHDLCLRTLDVRRDF